MIMQTYDVSTMWKMHTHTFVMCTQCPSLCFCCSSILLLPANKNFQLLWIPVIQGSAAHLGKHTYMCTQTKIMLPATSESMRVRKKKWELLMHPKLNLNKGLLSSCRLVNYWCSRGSEIKSTWPTAMWVNVVFIPFLLMISSFFYVFYDMACLTLWHGTCLQTDLNSSPKNMLFVQRCLKTKLLLAMLWGHRKYS